ncbi:MAG TPA: sulfocyanin-like copper-binding protein [Longimicrobiales bacterium]|nr:sulfocyanin-like copper-binding protein [Longimicrobiales bacterium]
MKLFSTLSLVVALAACGGGEPAENAPDAPATAPAAQAAAPSLSEMTMPDWFHVDEAGKTVHMTITAGLTDVLNHWNYNGYTKGEATITVPEGYTINIDLVNKDPVMAHSLGISTVTSGFGAMLDQTVAFDGAVTSDAASMTDATMPGETESISFVASKAGNYSMACFIVGHAATGMWIHFNVSADGSAGVQTTM